MKTADIREAFLAYFESKNHTRVASSSLVPTNDPTLLFANAGMNQFKDIFLGIEHRNYKRACSSQRCVRAGGKHNDLENIGYTARHHTFFEMLGSFSFGDYFKREAIHYAWQFLTETLGLPQDRLWITVHISDDEAAKIWISEIGIDLNRLAYLEEDNFWQMGDTGPCGPCSEIFYDHGPDLLGGPPGSPDDDLDRYVEIWNLVFMQYNRDPQGELHPLPAPSVDTGMGLERVAAVLQGVHSNYDIDLFRSLIAATAATLKVDDFSHPSLKIIADHIRSCSFLIADGVIPGNEGRGYVLRRIIRRAVRHGNKLGATETFFYRLVPELVTEMGGAYANLREKQTLIMEALRSEEEQFARTLEKGMDLLEEALSNLSSRIIPGDLIFLLYDTYGFPVDLTNDIARERGLMLDTDGYESQMNEQRQRSKEQGTFRVNYSQVPVLDGCTKFVGHENDVSESTVVALLFENKTVTELVQGDIGVVILDNTPFYAEGGGQVGDVGSLFKVGTSLWVSNTTKSQDQHMHHASVIKGQVSVGDKVTAEIDISKRQRTRLNHSATHLLHESLRRVLGAHVTQRGSLVQPEKFRFDFSHPKPVTPDELAEIAELVNAQIRENSTVSISEMSMEEALNHGATALFGEKYGDVVRVLSMGTENFSVELCAGTHVKRTGDIGLLRIVSESGIASGVRRIECLTGSDALAHMASVDAAVLNTCEALKINPNMLLNKVMALRQEVRELEKTVARLKQKLASGSGGDLVSKAVEVEGIQVLAAELDGVDKATLRQTLDQCKNKLGTAVVLLATVDNEKIILVAGVTKNVTNLINAGDLITEFAGRLNGRGGGRPEMAQGGGSDLAALPSTLKALPGWVAAQLAG